MTPAVSTPAAPSPAVNDALSVLQKMHAETARLHRQFLDGQATALRTLEALVQPGVRTTSAPVVAASPSAAPATLPAALPPRSAPLMPAPATVTSPAPVAKPQASAGNQSTHQTLTPVVLAVVAEKTGYPVEMLKPAMSLDHDLGIDSIKRVEILSALQEKLPELPAVTPEQLQTLHRLEDVIALLEASGPVGKTAKPQALSAMAEERSSTPVEVELLRGVVTATALEPTARVPLNLPVGGVFWITDDGSPLAAAVAHGLEAAGFAAKRIAWNEITRPAGDEPLAGVVLIAPMAGLSDHQLWHAIAWAQEAGPALKQMIAAGRVAVFATVSHLDGRFGLDTDGPLADVVSGGLAGLTKTVRHEWPNVVGKALDVGGEWSDPAAAAPLLVEELLHAGPVECGLSPAGRVTVTTDNGVIDDTSSVAWQPGDLVLVTGGARGVTAAAARAVAQSCRPRLVLLGRSPAPQPEPDWLCNVREEPQIKQALATHGQASSPRELQEQCQRILAAREIVATLADLRAVGVEAEYRGVDVREASAVRDLIDELRRAHGPVRGLIHGAGVLADQRIEDKTQEQFDRVFGTKIAGLRNVLAAIDGDELRSLVLFSSFTARYGRTGQVDYAIANEVLNKLGQQWRRQHPACRVISFNWGPWDGGMVQGGLKTLFAKEGVGLIPLAAGADLVATQWTQPPSSAVEVVVLGPGSQPFVDDEPSAPVPAIADEPTDPETNGYRVAFERTLSVDRAPYLASHVLGGRAVLPVAMIVEWLGHAAMHRNPGLEFRGLDNLRVFQGLKLGANDNLPLQVQLGKPQRVEGQYKVPAQLVSRNGERQIVHAGGDVWLGAGMSLTSAAPVRAQGPRSEWTAGDPYALLFHGPAFQGITAVEHCDAESLVLTTRTAKAPAEWTPEPFRPAWLADPLALDAALQGLILWCRTERDRPCLPTGWAAYRQFQRSFPAEEVTIVIRPTAVGEHRVTADVEFRDRAGQLVAQLTGCDNVLDAGLTAAFGQSELAAVR
jgi:NAD(P)-dependent dehydrogenase (short-subunit alcohol dehydrogenase family)/acyl carrier protein